MVHDGKQQGRGKKCRKNTAVTHDAARRNVSTTIWNVPSSAKTGFTVLCTISYFYA